MVFVAIFVIFAYDGFLTLLSINLRRPCLKLPWISQDPFMPYSLLLKSRLKPLLVAQSFQRHYKILRMASRNLLLTSKCKRD